ncbi:phytanoyl-CoA dioxygenase family protein [Sphingomonas sp. So64.6b]|uniref:phytanoyl-CoA dioxygenase family protein n=1 Tax=Sphingomonas sp. So64.6b TaxID=2997354 RepID=UPI001FCE89AF|nr:phytanoyl-CoA dioxygenase family protein [Sphingomonas sp. So64.6b]
MRSDRAALSILGALDDLADRQPQDRAGIRLRGVEALAPLLANDGSLGALAARTLGSGCRPVRAILFDKTEATNWALGWHQDRTIVVRERRETPGFGPWTVKAGLIHVAPPADLLAGMVTMRVHLDPVPADNAPLLIAPGSHRFGRIAEGDIDAVVERCGTIACLAERGDVWLYATLILHASEAATRPTRRRVLQIDFAADNLPGDLDWLGLQGGEAAP